MQVPVFSHPDCIAHDPGPGHPESPERLRVLLARLREAPFVDLRESPTADLADLLMIHDASYLARLAETAQRGGGVLDADTIMNSASWDAARRSAGGAQAAVDHALEYSATAFSAGRPPGWMTRRTTYLQEYPPLSLSSLPLSCGFAGATRWP